MLELVYRSGYDKNDLDMYEFKLRLSAFIDTIRVK